MRQQGARRGGSTGAAVGARGGAAVGGLGQERGGGAHVWAAVRALYVGGM